MPYNKTTREKYLEANKVKIASQKKAYYEANRLKLIADQKNYQKENKSKIRAYQKNKMATDILYKMKNNIKNYIKNSIKNLNFNKSKGTIDIIGCSFQELKSNLESKFEPWMNWENYGNPKDGILEPNKTWDIDHIKPLATAKDICELINLNHYTNLQPLCSYVNRIVKRAN
jgi:hypothetical protein